MLLTSRCPTGEELYNIRRTVLTDDDWDLTQPCFTGVHQFSKDYEYKRLVSLFTMSVTLTSTMTPMDSVYENSEYDIAMAEISPGYNDRTFAIACLAYINIATHVRGEVDQDNSIDGRRIPSVIAEKGKHGKHNSKSISRKWGIGVDYSRNTLNGTTQKWGRIGTGPLSRKYRANHLLFGTHRCRLHIQWRLKPSSL